MNDKNMKGQVDTTGDAIGASVGGASGIAAGAALGSAAGPIGTIIGGLAGAVGGWWSGRAVSEAMSTYTSEDEQYYQTQHDAQSEGTSASRASFADARPAYQLGHLAGVNPDYAGRSFNDVESHLKSAYSSAGHQNWTDVRAHAQAAYERGGDVGEQRLTLAEEELRVGKRQVQAGEVSLHKTVETERVRETVQLMHDEVTIERRPVTDQNASRHVEIGENEIRIPLMAEEAVVEKRVVGKEEVVLRKHQVTENENIEADLRKERVDVDRSQTATGGALAGGSDLANHAKKGAKSFADKVADTVDDVKDRVDGNPSSKPGRDSTDRASR